jgi:hypothetical protein
MIDTRRGFRDRRGGHRARHSSSGGRLAEAEVEGLAAFLARPHFELHVGAFAQFVEAGLRPHLRAMEEDFLAAVVGRDEAEALILYNLLDGAKHS